MLVLVAEFLQGLFELFQMLGLGAKLLPDPLSRLTDLHDECIIVVFWQDGDLSPNHSIPISLWYKAPHGCNVFVPVFGSQCGFQGLSFHLVARPCSPDDVTILPVAFAPRLHCSFLLSGFRLI